MQNNQPNILSLWKRLTKTGQPFYAGELNIAGENKKIIIFFKTPNGQNNRPDIIIKEQVQQPQQQGQPAPQQQATAPQRQEYQPAPQQTINFQQQQDDINIVDIPF